VSLGVWHTKKKDQRYDQDAGCDIYKQRQRDVALQFNSIGCQLAASTAALHAVLCVVVLLWG
jgi:hypothetical protein